MFLKTEQIIKQIFSTFLNNVKRTYVVLVNICVIFILQTVDKLKLTLKKFSWKICLTTQDVLFCEICCKVRHNNHGTKDR